MKPLLTLLISFIVTVVISKLFSHNWNIVFAGNLAMCLMLLLTATGHFLFTKGMTLMLPAVIPFRILLVYFTGITEVLLGISLIFHPSRFISGMILIAFFILLLPANIYAAVKRLDIENATYNGPGLKYLWFRVPLQFLFIAWVVYFSVCSLKF